MIVYTKMTVTSQDWLSNHSDPNSPVQPYRFKSVL